MTSHLHDTNDVSPSHLEDLLVLPLFVAPAFVALGGVAVPEAGSHMVVVAEPDECDGHQAGVLVRVSIAKPCVVTNVLSKDTVTCLSSLGTTQQVYRAQRKYV